MMGLPLAFVIGYFARWLNQFLGWRLTFVIMDCSLVLAALALFTD